MRYPIDFSYVSITVWFVSNFPVSFEKLLSSNLICFDNLPRVTRTVIILIFKKEIQG